MALAGPCAPGRQVNRGPGFLQNARLRVVSWDGKIVGTGTVGKLDLGFGMGLGVSYMVFFFFCKECLRRGKRIS